jgi:hypothetical protein
MEVPCSSQPAYSVSGNIQRTVSFSTGLVAQVGRDFKGKIAIYLISDVIISSMKDFFIPYSGIALYSHPSEKFTLHRCALPFPCGCSMVAYNLFLIS